MAQTAVFISYKTGEDDGLTFGAHTIRQFLEQHARQYTVWMDSTSLRAGEEWNRQIYEHIPRSDVLLLLVAEATAKSHWVAREVDFAKGARVTILPVLIRSGFDIKQVMERFDLSTVQYVSLLNGTAEEFAKLAEAIEELKDRTATHQKRWLEQLGQQRGRTPYTKDHRSNRDFAAFNAPELDCQVGVAAGDMFDMRDIDVYVNSENDYMQMARIFESKTVSALLRYYGSELDGAGRIVADSVQDELDQHIHDASDIRVRPVSIGAVIATSAGLRTSHLRTKCGARYIFHTATVSVEGDGIAKTLQCRLIEEGIRRCVRNTLEKVFEVDRKAGVISPEGTRQRGEQQADVAGAAYRPIRSIILPLFGAGHGGRPSEEIMPALVRGVKEFLIDVSSDAEKKGTFHLKRIHLAAYFEEDAALLRDALNREVSFFTPVAAGSG